MTGTHRPSRRAVLGAGTGLAVAAAAGSRAGATARPRDAGGGRPPNIVLIMLDDVGYGDVSRLGSRRIRTPHIDGVGAGGVTFSQMYSPGPVCTPARAGLLTGRYAQRVGLPWVPGPGAPDGMPAYERTLGEILRERGYRTGIFGKWHLGDPAERPELNPLHHGFDSFYGIPGFNTDVPFPVYDGTEIVDRLEGAEQTGLPRRHTDRALGFVRRNRHRPFFLYLPYTLAHKPYYAERRFQGSSQAGPYGDLVQQADFHIGRVLRELRACGLEENTLVLITSDNGPDEHGTGGLRAGKGYTFEGGIRMPFLARWPQRIAPGTTYDDPACLTDVLPTVAAVTGCELPDDRPMDGVDLSAALRGGRPAAERVLYHYHDWTLNAVRRGRWKLHLPGRRNGLPPGPGGPRPPLLYDIDGDPGERHDLAAAHGRTVRELTELGARFDEEIQAGKDRALARARHG
ncbi:sulfatase-like hydrolase/transferase [Streptomyces sp. WMMC500]|uniref:sulfatase-like hydrolase/transferase n=1 Tax=Streptomyces sp. WMMC500 TaxID=3015154 RepID=UPI00248B7479|nr:sulfatase-like hydrolase/transferase [Streptomyces sp. WMMC500]WBB62460.1 sulfatase-like hydrolase/transferase [Streptomyces sp. WMMC500]